MELFEYLKNSQKSLFRFESLQYLSEDKESLDKYLKTGKVDMTDNAEWFDFLKSKNKGGVSTKRVRLVTLPINDYTKFEIEVFKVAKKYGDDIKIIMDSEFNQLDLPKIDFWNIDNKTVLKLNYDESGKYLEFENDSLNFNFYKSFQDEIIKHSIEINDLNEYI
ncbi:MAG: hypothetical protein Q9M91_04230 [Candidatus Dojkabacteria bacterium]|nr:hypothetical protein [Candidatus Dojkabacteria bacterium]MDQ7021021.1 hypothetical protein [Candidatus Dojkabacteria bacterium]